MLFGKYAAFTAVGLLAFAALPAQSDTIASNTAGRLNATTAVGQSVTVSNGSYSNLTFNWYDTNQAATAVGTLYLLDKAYAGLAGDLSSSTTGFLAASTKIENNQYKFDYTLVATPLDNKFYFYTDSSLTFTGQGNTYAGGNLYMPRNNDITNGFLPLERLDANFLLAGTSVLGAPTGPNAVPEPSAVAFLAASILIGAAFLRRRKQAVNIA